MESYAHGGKSGSDCMEASEDGVTASASSSGNMYSMPDSGSNARSTPACIRTCSGPVRDSIKARNIIIMKSMRGKTCRM